MTYESVAFVGLSVVALLAALMVLPAVRSWCPPFLLLGAVAARIAGAAARYETLFRYYDGVGDATGYYRTGLLLAHDTWAGDLSLLEPGFWLHPDGSWWGTEFVRKVSGAVLLVIGPSLRAEFLAFSLFAFIGLFAMALAVRRVAGGRAAALFSLWVWFWPSLVFWPSSVGKEALVTLAVGFAVLGYAGRGRRIHWSPFLAGLALCFCVRPHVAAILGLAAAAAYWLGSWRRMSVRRVAEGLLVSAVAAAALVMMASSFSTAGIDLEGLGEYVSVRTSRTLVGASSLGSTPLTGGHVAQAPVNALLRPFLWEAHNLQAAIAAAEVSFLWLLVWRYRRALLYALRHARQHRLLRVALPFLCAYLLMIGLTFGNLGLISRQRSIAYPFVFMVLLAGVVPERARPPRETVPGMTLPVTS